MSRAVVTNRAPPWSRPVVRRGATLFVCHLHPTWPHPTASRTRPRATSPHASWDTPPVRPTTPLSLAHPQLPPPPPLLVVVLNVAQGLEAGVAATAAAMLLLPLAVPAPASPLSSLQPLLELSPRALPLLLLLPMVLLTWLTVELCVDIIFLAYACTMAIACPQSSQRRRAVASRTRTLKAADYNTRQHTLGATRGSSRFDPG